MSFVGPATRAAEMIEKLAKRSVLPERLMVQPGITAGAGELPVWGSARMRGRKLEYDLYYMKNMVSSSTFSSAGYRPHRPVRGSECSRRARRAGKSHARFSDSTRRLGFRRMQRRLRMDFGMTEALAFSKVGQSYSANPHPLFSTRQLSYTNENVATWLREQFPDKELIQIECSRR